MFLSSLLFLFLNASVEAQEGAIQGGKWVDTDAVCFSNNKYDAAMARTTCEEAAKVVHLMSNNNIVFQAHCKVQEAGDQCTYVNGYVLQTKAMLVLAN